MRSQLLAVGHLGREPATGRSLSDYHSAAQILQKKFITNGITAYCEKNYAWISRVVGAKINLPFNSIFP